MGLLEHTKQPKLSDKEVICLEDISEDAKVEVEHFTRGSQKILYICHGANSGPGRQVERSNYDYSKLERKGNYSQCVK
jgi:hypothetical protein